MNKIIPLINDRTSIEVDWECGMRYWWYKLEGGKGIVPVKRAAYFQQGADFHEDLSLFPKGATIDDILASIDLKQGYVDGVADPLILETLYRRQGWAVAFGTWIWPWIMENYEIVNVENEIILDRGDLWIQIKPDLILRHKKTRKLWYIEYKTAGTTDNRFALHWPYAIQLHLGIKAVEEELGEEVSHASVLGFNKGTEKEGKLRHPYVYAYTDGDQWQTAWKKDWGLTGLWEAPFDLKSWVLELGEDVGRKQFAWSYPIHVDERLLDLVVARRLVREQEIAAEKEACQADLVRRNIIFEMRTTKCKPIWGPPCEYLACCFNKVVGDDPLKSGQYEVRTPHHELDIVGVE